MTDAVTIRDRVKELKRVPASDLIDDPRNWRTHPQAQRAVLSSMLAEVGIADALIVRENGDGRYVIIDGHLRRSVLNGQDVPVLVLDVDEDEAGKLLLTLDPLAAMASADQDRLAELLDAYGAIENADVSAMLTALAKASGLDALTSARDVEFKAYDQDIPVEHTCPRCGYQFSGGAVTPGTAAPS